MNGMLIGQKNFALDCQLLIPDLQEGKVVGSTSYYDEVQHKE
jgi:hypothetical protein